MKTERRHELETNWLAQRLAETVERSRPYVPAVAGAILVVVVLMFVWSLYTSSTTARQSEAWDAYNESVQGLRPNLEQLRQSAEAHPGTAMQELADVTWADGQVWLASRDYLHFRSAAMEALERADSAYQGVIRSTSDPRLRNRARFGLARVYEMQNDLEKAREQYLLVEGALGDLAKLRAEQLAKPQVADDYSWLATAEPPRREMPFGPGTPGQRPDFSPGDFSLPGTPGGAPAGTTLDSLLQGLDLGSGFQSGPDRYGPEDGSQEIDLFGGQRDPAETAPTDGGQPPADGTVDPAAGGGDFSAGGTDPANDAAGQPSGDGATTEPTTTGDPSNPLAE